MDFSRILQQAKFVGLQDYFSFVRQDIPANYLATIAKQFGSRSQVDGIA
jgi:hypothetical protein